MSWTYLQGKREELFRHKATLVMTRRRLLACWATWMPGVQSFAYTPTRVAGLIPVAFVSAIISVAYYAAVPLSLIPMLATSPNLATILLVIFHFIFGSTVANYALLVFADPGSMPTSWRVPQSAGTTMSAQMTSRKLESHRHTDEDEHDIDYDVEEQLAIQRHPLIARRSDSASAPASSLAQPQLSDDAATLSFLDLLHERSQNGQHRYCHKCNNYKSDRSHHCSVCNKCVLLMDHHCVFIGNCVGFMNHKFFVSFVTYAFCGCAFVAVVAFPTFLVAIGESGRVPRQAAAEASTNSGGKWYLRIAAAALASARRRPELSSAQSIVLVVGYILVSSFAFALLLFVTFHWYLVAKGLTTIELYDLTDPARAARVRRYNLGLLTNIKSVFGVDPRYWPLPTRYGIPGDGLSFPRAQMRSADHDSTPVSPV
jgi:DHHC palmitoyltransferase